MSVTVAYTVPLSGFTNPKYFAASVDDAKGFDLSGAQAYSVSFTGTGVSTVVHEQTNDPSGAAGWFPVAGKVVSGLTATIATSGSTSGSNYMFPVVGARARIRVTALTTSDAIAQIALLEKAFEIASPVSAVTVTGPAAHDAAISGNPVRIGARALTANFTGVATGDVVDMAATVVGAQIVKPYSIPEADWTYAAAASGIVNTTTAVTVKAAAGAGIRNYITGLQIAHATLGAVTEFAIRDGAAGTVLFRIQLQTAAKEDIQIEFPTPLRGTANTLLEIVTLTAVTGGVYANLQGYAAP